jgi:hypothetical protein
MRTIHLHQLAEELFPRSTTTMLFPLALPLPQARLREPPP